MKSRCDHRSCDCDLSNRKVSDSYNIHMIQKYITEKRNDFFFYCQENLAMPGAFSVQITEIDD